MRRADSFALVLVTAPDVKTARRLARLALRAGLVACANLVPRIESHYWWQGRIQSGAEVLVLFKSRRRSLAGLERLVVKEHPYDTPEFLVVALHAGNARYLEWLADPR